MSTATVADARRAARAPLDAGQALWLAAIPTAAITLLALLALGPPLGRLLLPTPRVAFWPDIAQFIRPEPTEQARFLIALTAPLTLSGLAALLVRRPPAWLARVPAATAVAAELAAVAFAAACFVVQRTQPGQNGLLFQPPYRYFTLASCAAAAAIAAVLIAAARSPRVRARFAAWTRESPARRRAAVGVAVAAVVVTLLPGFNTDGSIAHAHEQVSFHVAFLYDEALAVRNGLSPLRDYAAQYASLWPYAIAAAMALLGSSLAVFSGLVLLLSASALLALFGVLRRLTRSSAAGLLLFLPLLATSAYHLRGGTVNRFSLVNYFGVLPMRYAGPFLLAWLVARQLDGARPRRAWPLFLAAGLVALNNTDFGIPALGATIAALAWARDRGAGQPVRALAAEAAAGLAGALALTTALLLARTGALPRFGLLVRYDELFVRAGFNMLPIRPAIGLHTIVFLTYVAAIGTATLGALRGSAERAMTGMLAWSGVFGLGAGAYYAGRSRSEQLVYMFPAWALALALLTILALRWLAASRARTPRPAVVACLLGFGLLVCSLAQTPAPWSQARRITASGPPIYAHPFPQDFVAAHTHRGEPVLILTSLGHRIALDLGIRDVEPYTGTRSIQSLEQLDDALRALQDAGGRKVFVLPAQTPQGLTQALASTLALGAQERGPGATEMWVERFR